VLHIDHDKMYCNAITICHAASERYDKDGSQRLTQCMYIALVK